MGILEEWFLKVLQFVFMVLVGSMLFENYRATRNLYDLGWAVSFSVGIIRQFIAIAVLGGIIYFGVKQFNLFYPVLDQAMLLLFYLFLVYAFYMDRIKSEKKTVHLGIATASGFIILSAVMLYYWKPFAENQIPYRQFWGNVFFSILHLSLVITISVFLYLKEGRFLRTSRQIAFCLFFIGHIFYTLGIFSFRLNIFLNMLAGILFFLGFIVFSISVIGYRIQFKLVMLLIITILLPAIFTVPLLSSEFKNSLINLGYKVFPVEELNEVAFSLKKILYLITGMGILVASSIGYLVSGNATSALSNLAMGLRKLGRGSLSTRIGLERKDEIGEISSEFNKMAKKLEDNTNELVSKQRQLIQLEKVSSIGRLAGGVAHEVNNPLTGVLGYSQLGKEAIEEIKKNYNDKELQKQLEILDRYFGSAEKGSLRCKEITSALLKFSRQIDAGKSEAVYMSEIIESVLSLIHVQPCFRFVKIEKHFAAGLPAINANKSQIMQVFLELILNAGHAMPDGGDLIIAVHREGENIIVKISDTGSGMSKEERDNIFMPFYTTQEVGKGKGLGLAISYGIIKAHNGTMDIESEKGKGTTVIIKLPINGKKFS